MHTWAQAASSGKPKGAIEALDWKRADNFSCDRSHGQSCFIHNMYFLDAKQSRVCSCGKSEKPQILDRNLFAETVYMEDLVGQLDDMIRKSPDAHSYRPEVKHKAIIG